MKIKYDKLVRDKIPEIISNDGKNALISKLEDKNQLRERLLEKLFEEVEEYKEDYDLLEIADILEIIYALIEIVEGKSFEEIDKMRLEKKEERGGFEKGIILEKVTY